MNIKDWDDVFFDIFDFQIIYKIGKTMTETPKRTILLSRAKAVGDKYIFSEQETFSPDFYPDKYHSTDGGTFFQYSFNSTVDTSLLFIYCNKVLDAEEQQDLLDKWNAVQN